MTLAHREMSREHRTIGAGKTIYPQTLPGVISAAGQEPALAGCSCAPFHATPQNITMISLEQTLADQRNLDTLCQTRPFRSPEIYLPNDNYGFARIIKLYSGYPLDRPLPVIVPHGIYLGNDKVIHPSEKNCPLQAVFSYPAFRTQLWKKKTKKIVIPAASPFIYALRLFTPETTERHGTLYFPPHSTAMVDVAFDRELMIRQLKELPEIFQPITVCVHWHDVQQGLHRFFAEQGFPVVSAGHLADPEFMFRWLHLLSGFRHALGSHIGGSLFYAVMAGLPFILNNTNTHFNPHPTMATTTPPTQQLVDRHHRIWSLFGRLSENITEPQLEMVKYCLGADEVKEPKALLQQLQSLMPK